VAALLQTSCSNCHNGTRHVDLRTTGLYPRLTGMLTAGSATMMGCASMALVVPGNTATSLLSKALHGAVSGCTTGVMPKACAGANCLTAAQIATIEGWIAAGAPM
jgi:hypothetical protein